MFAALSSGSARIQFLSVEELLTEVYSERVRLKIRSLDRLGSTTVLKVCSILSLTQDKIGVLVHPIEVKLVWSRMALATCALIGGPAFPGF